MVQWYVFANQRSVRIFSRLDYGRDIQLLEEKINPLSGVKPKDLLRHSPVPATGKLEVKLEVLDQFAKDIATDLDKGRLNKRFDSFTVISEPRLYGLLKKNLNKVTQKLLKSHSSEDVEERSIFELKKFILSELSPT